MAMKKYTSYQPSKTLWQEEIPSHWQETDLRMVFSENKERNTGLIERNLLSLSYGKLKRKDIDNATGLVPASFDGYQIIGNGYIVLRFTDLQNDKKSLRVGYCPERGIITNAYVAIAPKENTFSKYYYYQLHFLDTIKYFYNLGGGVRQSLSYKEFGRETVIVPKPDEQIKIAAFLDYKLAKIDRFILKKKQLIKLLNEQKAAIINQAVTKGLDPNVKMKPSGIEWLGDIPEHWEVSKLKYLSSKIGDGIHTTPEYNEKGNIPFINGNNLVNKKIVITEKTNTVDVSEFEKHKIDLKVGSILISINGTIGNLAFYNGEEVVFGKSAAFVELINVSYNQYLFYILNCNYIKEYFISTFQGTTINNLSLKAIRNTPVVIPPFQEQHIILNHIVSEAEIIDKTIFTIEKEITLTQEYKTALIAEAVTGKIDVRDYEIPKTQDKETYEDLEEELSIAAEEEVEYQNVEIEE